MDTHAISMAYTRICQTVSEVRQDQKGADMRLEALADGLSAVYAEGAMLLSEAGYDGEEDFDQLEWDRNDPESYRLLKAVKRAASALDQGRERFLDAQTPPGKLVYRLGLLPNGRYGYHKGSKTVEMYCGRRIEALLDLDGFLYWVPCIIESEDGEYYINQPGASLDGLIVREPKESSLT